eukprot:TRINITY_DN16928_c0_g2_i4.p1 TRINITY_DN16928_c0_g2~~TRINITY_DN16928_c0_g2_i4.p1  ORF type:complete len:276 (-),score=92.24 TRINITY_DN16928_c0_g2_i4:790-1617(-)
MAHSTDFIFATQVVFADGRTFEGPSAPSRKVAEGLAAQVALRELGWEELREAPGASRKRKGHEKGESEADGEAHSQQQQTKGSPGPSPSPGGSAKSRAARKEQEKIIRQMAKQGVRVCMQGDKFTLVQTATSTQGAIDASHIQEAAPAAAAAAGSEEEPAVAQIDDGKGQAPADPVRADGAAFPPQNGLALQDADLPEAANGILPPVVTDAPAVVRANMAASEARAAGDLGVPEGREAQQQEKLSLSLEDTGGDEEVESGPQKKQRRSSAAEEKE